MGCSVAGKGVLPYLARENTAFNRGGGGFSLRLAVARATQQRLKACVELKYISRRVARAELLHRRLDRLRGHAFPEVGLLDHSRRPSSLLGRVLHFFLPNLDSRLT